MLRETPQEAELLAIYFEEVAFHDAKEAARREKQQQQHSASASSAPRTNTGPGEFAVESVIGDDDEVDWSDALKAEADDDEE